MITPRLKLVDITKYALKCPYEMDAELICVHNTAMDSSAENEISYMIRNNYSTSYHFAIDDIEVVQGLPLDRNGFHAGDGSNGTGNRKSIGVEICHSKSGGEKYEKAEALAIRFIAQLLHERKWSVDKVKKHQDFSGKFCPHRILSEKRWDSFIAEIKSELDKLNGIDFHIVQSGDTLWGISRKYGMTVQEIEELNSGIVATELTIGSKIYIKPQVKPEPIEEVISEPTPKPIVPETYTVKAGDSLSVIASRYEIKLDDIIKWNSISNPSLINVGQVLYLTGEAPKEVKTESTIKVPQPVLRVGMKSSAVKELQQILYNHNPRFDTKGIDGHYGNLTKDAVLRYQLYYGLKPYDGIYGEKTAAKLKQTANS